MLAPLWIGAQRDGTTWMWDDGSEVNDSIPISVLNNNAALSTYDGLTNPCVYIDTALKVVECADADVSNGYVCEVPVADLEGETGKSRRHVTVVDDVKFAC